eukprot:2815491-Rhodomonas_salina.5
MAWKYVARWQVLPCFSLCNGLCYHERDVLVPGSVIAHVSTRTPNCDACSCEFSTQLYKPITTHYISTGPRIAHTSPVSVPGIAQQTHSTLGECVPANKLRISAPLVPRYGFSVPCTQRVHRRKAGSVP